jgi:hypothetical protein
MTRSIPVLGLVALSVVVVGGALSPAAAGGVHVGVHVGLPGVAVVAPAPVYAAPVVVAPPPPVIISPGVPVYYYGSHYYTHYNRAWFVGPAYGGPWSYVPYARVPRPIIAVPQAYVHVPHGHGRHIAGPPPWGHGHGRGHGGHGGHRH